MRAYTEHRFQTRDGLSLYYRYWPALADVPRGAIVLLHRGHEHAGRVAHLVDELDLPEFAFFALDARGHGRSGSTGVENTSISMLVADLEDFSRHLGKTHDVPQHQIAVVAQSFSAGLTAAWVHDYAPKIRGMVLVAPAFRIRLYVPLARPMLAAVLRFRKALTVKSYVQARHLTRDPVRIAEYDADPLITRSISARLLLELDRTARRIIDDAATLTVPTQLLVPGRDVVVSGKPQRAFFARLGARIKSSLAFPGLLHDALGELDRAPVVAAVREFLLERFDAPYEGCQVSHSRVLAHSQREEDQRQAPLPTFSWSGLHWRALRALLSLAGRWSTGIEIGLRTGFDSGASLDYVYQNRAQGKTSIGRVIDRCYLDAVGWRGIRQRKHHIEMAVREAVRSLRAADRPVRVLDVAAGRGRYVFDAFSGSERPDRVEFRDHSAANVIAGRASLAESGWSDRATYRQVDAFEQSIAEENASQCRGRFSFVLVSGLYELYADNELVRRSLVQISAELEPGGYLIYTGQPWHPQLTFIARTLTRERDGAPWVMRCRPQAELDALIESAGFEKLMQSVDETGIFTVSLARKTTECSGVSLLTADTARRATA